MKGLTDLNVCLKIVTFNIRTENAMDGVNSFSKRKDGICAFFNRHQPDILCFQELTPAMAAAIAPRLSGYYMVGCGREANFDGEQCSVAYKRDIFRLVRAETFWLSDTPEKAGSRYAYQSRHPRICTVLWLSINGGRSKGKLLRIYNTHLDHVEEYARTMGLTLILRHMEDRRNWPELSTVLTGDFNAVPGSEPLRVLEQSVRPSLLDITKELPCTFHNYGKAQEKIDYIFTDRRTAEGVKEVGICHGEQENEGLYLSDHYPVEAQLYV